MTKQTGIGWDIFSSLFASLILMVGIVRAVLALRDDGGIFEFIGMVAVVCLIVVNLRSTRACVTNNRYAGQHQPSLKDARPDERSE